MKFLIVFLSTFLLVSSTDIKFLDDYPEALNCFYNAPKQKDRLPLSQEILEVGKKRIADCIDNFAKSDSKVGQIQQELTSIFLQAYEFKQVDEYVCGAKVKSLPVSECFESTGMKPGDNFCNEVIGKDGCMLPVFEETCGSEFVAKLRNLISHDRRYHVCLD
ncbi:unnamed protein product [Caenorhabditis angaria]|uniref:T20D4.11-like domain-containing protein n=1 Tax=Caenorhabditis angaria TaxID=860376 RepID=A0A9P1IFP7_9PELO|nr:unnamed protein product [Caenorhabditis angaria]